jgi:hypothetical protein
MSEGSGRFPNYRVDNEANPQRITHIHDVELPEGVLYTAPDLAPETRVLTPEAVRRISEVFEWAEDSRRDADEE